MLKFATIFASIYVLIFCLLLLYDKNKIIKKIITIMTIAYLGFNTHSLKGIIKGLLWAFIDGFLTGFIVYFIINLFT
jgi:hypothetical protein